MSILSIRFNKTNDDIHYNNNKHEQTHTEIEQEENRKRAAL